MILFTCLHLGSFRNLALDSELKSVSPSVGLGMTDEEGCWLYSLNDPFPFLSAPLTCVMG